MSPSPITSVTEVYYLIDIVEKLIIINLEIVSVPFTNIITPKVFITKRLKKRFKFGHYFTRSKTK